MNPFAAEKDINIVFLGGSITEGAGASDVVGVYLSELNSPSSLTLSHAILIHLLTILASFLLLKQASTSCFGLFALLSVWQGLPQVII